MKILIAPDNFKGSLSAKQVAEAIKKGIHQFDPNIETILHPLADGGDGSLETLNEVLKLETVRLHVANPLGEPVPSFYLKNDSTAFIEMAKASGWELLKPAQRNPMYTSTFGTGQLIADALQKGVESIYLFIGGSATSEAGMGMAAALGYQFKDANNNLIQPMGKRLIDIHSIDDTYLIDRLKEVKFWVVCDVKNMLYGKSGAAHVYAAQKGANPYEVEFLDKGLRNISAVVNQQFGLQINALIGGGAAGGLGAGAVAFLGAQIIPGIQTILELTHFEEKLSDVDLIISGEGQLDEQTLKGKVISGLSEIANKRGIALAVICGTLAVDEEIINQLNIQEVIAIKKPDESLDDMIDESESRVTAAAVALLKNMKI